jgi:hypothetical protein
MEDFDRHQREIEQWRAVVGKAIVSFGELELITHQCLVHIPSDKISDTSSRLPFARRVDLIIEILEGRMPIVEPVSKFIQMLKRTRKLAETRNDIAHYPVMMNVFIHKASGDVLLERSIATARGGRIIDLPGLKEFADEVEDLAASMWLQIGKIGQGSERH